MYYNVVCISTIVPTCTFKSSGKPTVRLNIDSDEKVLVMKRSEKKIVKLIDTKRHVTTRERKKIEEKTNHGEHYFCPAFPRCYW